MTTIIIDPLNRVPPVRDGNRAKEHPFPKPKETHRHPKHTPSRDHDNASVTFVGAATTLLRYGELTIMTDPNFLHAGDHVHLGPGVTGTRITEPSLDIDELPPIDVVLLSHYHADHFDQVVEARLRRDLPIVTTVHAKECLTEQKDGTERFTDVTALGTWESASIEVKGAGETVKVTAMPGKHVPPGVLETINNLLGAVPPVNGWMLELGSAGDPVQVGYRIYITGDTLLIDDLRAIPERYQQMGKPIDLMLAHLGGTTIPGASLPMLMVTMDAKMGIELMRIMEPDITIPIHYDDYDVFLSPLSDFKREMENAGLADSVVFLKRGDEYRFKVKAL